MFEDKKSGENNSSAKFELILLVAWDRIELPTRGFSVVNDCYFNFN